MHFIIEDKVFEVLPEVCFGVVVARSVDNSGHSENIRKLLVQAMEETREKFRSVKPKEHPDFQPYRDAFKKMDINPNKFPCSVEALTNRIVKGGNLPGINPVVDLVNTYSLKYTLPMGAHDLNNSENDIEVRFSASGDTFIPFGKTEPEKPDEEELVYAGGNTVKTRKWIWRQSDRGKVTGFSKNIFCPIDGFANYNREKVIEARNELASSLEYFLRAKVNTYYLDKSTRKINIM